MQQEVEVKSYIRKRGGKKVKVSAYRRHQRVLGKKIRYKKVQGTFLVAQDNYGNFRGSRIQKRRRIVEIKKPVKKVKLKRKRIESSYFDKPTPSLMMKKEVKKTIIEPVRRKSFDINSVRNIKDITRLNDAYINKQIPKKEWKSKIEDITKV